MQVFTHFTANDVQLEPFPFKNELSMQAYLVENEGVLGLDKDVFSNVEILSAEVAIKDGRKNGDGRIDILATYSPEYIAVLELKNEELDEEALGQLADYLTDKSKESILKKYPNKDYTESVKTPKWIGVLVGSSITPELANKISLHNGKDYLLAALTLQRYRGANGNVFVITDTYFNRVRATRDTTQYSFNGNSYGKGRLVLAAMKHFVDMNKTISYAELEQIFPKKLQGTYGVFATLEMAQQIQNNGRRRHFLNRDELIVLVDGPIAISDQWGIGNINEFKAYWNNLNPEFQIG